MQTKDDFPRVLFFFGAGASKPAGIGTTTELVDEFRKFLEKKKKTNLLRLLNKIIERISDDVVDIERIMMIVDKLVMKDDDDVFKIYRINVEKSEFESIPDLNDEIKKFIQKITMVKSDKINYLKPLRSFPKPRKIISVNYDTAIEQFCNIYKMKYTDGFEYEWEPNLFNDDNFDFHLFKLHGSIIWYKTDRNKYIKLPLPPKGKIELIFGEKASPLILYPMQKWDFVEPLLENIFKFKMLLHDIDFVIFIGYSFRDSHILRILHEASQKNTKLTVILIDPNAREIYKQKLQFYHDQETKSDNIPSALNERVLCLNYPVESILDKLKDIVIDCQNAMKEEMNYEKNLIDGYDPHPFDVIEKFSKIEFIDRATNFANKINWIEEHSTKINTKLLKSSLKLFSASELQNYKEYSDYWLSKFLYGFTIFVHGIFRNMQIHPNGFSFPTFDQYSNHSGSGWDVDDMLSYMKEKEKRVETLPEVIMELYQMTISWFKSHKEISGNLLTYKEYLKRVKDFSNNYHVTLPIKLEKKFTKLLDDNYFLKTSTKEYSIKDSIEKLESFKQKLIFKADSPTEYFSKKYPKKRIYYHGRLGLFGPLDVD